MLLIVETIKTIEFPHTHLEENLLTTKKATPEGVAFNLLVVISIR